MTRYASAMMRGARTIRRGLRAMISVGFAQNAARALDEHRTDLPERRACQGRGRIAG